MSFAKDTARMKRILQACEASPEILRDFDNLCHFRKTESAEELLREICVRHGFTRPYARESQQVVIRPYSLRRDHPNYHSDDSDDDLNSEQSYRRGYDQGANEVLEMLQASATIAQVEPRLREIHQWRTQPIQCLHAAPGEQCRKNCPIIGFPCDL
jgi:hypothetical protein